MLDKDQLNDIVAGIAKNYSEREEIFFTDPNKHFPNKLAIVNIVKDLRRVMFPRYFGDETPTGINPEYFIGETLIRIEDSLRRELREALLERHALDELHDDILRIAAVPHIIHRDDVRLREHGDGVCLRLKAVFQLGILRHLITQDLDGDIAVQLMAHGLINDRHAAAADDLQDLVAIVQHLADITIH